jgi:mitochondrial import inner membrane translocase subunit TIM8
MSSFDDQRAQQELQMLLMQEQQREIVQGAVLKLTDLCWNKCVTKPQGTLSSAEQDCVTACTERYLDTVKLVSQKFMGGAGN